MLLRERAGVRGRQTKLNHAILIALSPGDGAGSEGFHPRGRSPSCLATGRRNTNPRINNKIPSAPSGTTANVGIIAMLMPRATWSAVSAVEDRPIALKVTNIPTNVARKQRTASATHTAPDQTSQRTRRVFGDSAGDEGDWKGLRSIGFVVSRTVVHICAAVSLYKVYGRHCNGHGCVIP